MEPVGPVDPTVSASLGSDQLRCCCKLIHEVQAIHKPNLGTIGVTPSLQLMLAIPAVSHKILAVIKLKGFDPNNPQKGLGMLCAVRLFRSQEGFQ